MLWSVCGLDGLQSVKWCRMVQGRRAYGEKWWHEIVVWRGMSWCDFKCFVIWIYIYNCKVMSSVQGSLLFLYYVVFNVMSVQYCLCVSRIQCIQCSVSVSSVLQHSMQVVFRVYSISSVSLKHSVYSIGQSLQHTQSMVFSVSWVSVSVPPLCCRSST